MVSLDDIFGGGSDDEEETESEGGYGEGGYGDGEYGGEDVSEAEKCGMIIDIASEKAMERCGDEAVKAQVSQMFGIDFTELDCSNIPEGPIEGENIEDARKRAACQAIELSDEYCLRTAISKAWDEIEE